MGKLMKKKFLILLALTVLFFKCDEKDIDVNYENENVVVNNSLYNQTETNNYTITNVQLTENELTVKISSSGCSGDSWKAILVDANLILESFPIQRNIKLALENNEACLAVFEKEFTFDISTLKEDYESLYLNLEGWNSQIFYE